MDASYGTLYRTLYERHWWWRVREHVILDTLQVHRPPSGWSDVLDIGCGDGLFFDRLAEMPGVRVVEGVEPDASLVSNLGPHRDRIHVQPFDASFDTGRRYSLILMLDVLEHMSDPAGALRHAAALLRPGGRVVVTVPAFEALWTRHDDLNHHETRYRKRTLEPLVLSSGLEVLESRYFFTWLAAAKLGVRAIEMVTHGRPKPPRMPPRLINTILFGASRLEQHVLGRLGIPFGSSLIAVAGWPETGRKTAPL
ncbi:MAG: class I SAM-dependent methyltransferase [Gemmatimonadaceae bacterium]|nr:class I SAM-dependent methyltransferase [Gemmatimonadaceae bacterium]